MTGRRWKGAGVGLTRGSRVKKGSCEPENLGKGGNGFRNKTDGCVFRFWGWGSVWIKMNGGNVTPFSSRWWRAKHSPAQTAIRKSSTGIELTECPNAAVHSKKERGRRGNKQKKKSKVTESTGAGGKGWNETCSATQDPGGCSMEQGGGGSRD